ncbi:MAG TPA: type IV toxin-antitoxin system AbiEi family antitoxin domain-containing protein [Segeticoccus sp.]|uniref:type IV toxin-antitoxin system AbiEi family antitoxin domain-containing protein n=1 Tax=Segeticoccus sp. TaxID=2706531 RepID=UPI002D7F475E|nr:type IV toxin-antitoxin system AbiEi family antitoxin domain-containing protein [Segeticoccus sp.]HET8600108.1 type IV toxin-antitoxin system AbiEi family antitoxin domain-containing protein [Segeticoccus sp.]
MSDEAGAELREIARRQLGVVTRAQCLTSGMTLAQTRWKLRSGRWRSIHPGIYLTHSGTVGWKLRAAAAVLACGPGAVLAGRAAARWHTLVDDDPATIDVQVPARRRVRPPARVRVRRVTQLEARTARLASWPPRTSVEDTVLDVAEASSPREAEALVARACQRGLTTIERLGAALGRRGRHRWRDLFRVALEDVADGAESIAEIRYIRGVERAHGLPRAIRQLRVVRGGRRQRDDNLYEAEEVLVEVDGRVGHVGDGRLRDRRRDRRAAASGLLTLRVGWVEVSAEECETARDIAEVLMSRGWSGPLESCGADCRAFEPDDEQGGTSVAS